MAAVFGKGRFAWRIRAIFAEKGFAVNVFQRIKTPDNVRRHIQSRVCLLLPQVLNVNNNKDILFYSRAIYS